MTPDKSKTMDAAEKLMLDLMEKHPGASESSLLALFQNVARERPDVLRAIIGNFMKAQLGPIARAAPWLRLNVCLWHIVGRDGRIPSLLSGQFQIEVSNVR
jgi:hypothetical protein